MAEQLPLRKYVKVWIMKRKNNPRKGGRPPTTSYTLQWLLSGEKHVRSLGTGATLASARLPHKQANQPNTAPSARRAACGTATPHPATNALAQPPRIPA